MTKAKKFSLTELLNQRSMEQLEDASGEQTPQAEEIVMVDVHDLEPSRENFYQVDDSLKRSVELVGILQPLLVERPRKVPGDCGTPEAPGRAGTGGGGKGGTALCPVCV